MIAFPNEYNARKDAIFRAVATAAGLKAHPFRLIPMSLRGFPETAARAQTALARAKHQPRLGVLRALKPLLIRLQYNGARRFFASHPQAVALCWNGLTGSRLAYMTAAQDAGNRRLFAELSPLPGRITLDAQGINALSSLPKRAAFYTGWARANPQVAADHWRRLGAAMVARPSRRADVGQAQAALPDAPFLFVPLQVPDDSQVRLFSGWTGSVEGFITALSRAARHLPEGWHLRIKEHPSARQSFAPAIAEAATATGGRIVLDNDSDTFPQVAASRGVVTINSSVGLQAFFHDKPVIVTGQAFFAISGLVNPAENPKMLADAFTGADSLSYEPTLRDAFMSYLDQVYYPELDVTGVPALSPAAVARVLATVPR